MAAVLVHDATALDIPILVDFVLAEGREAEDRALDPGVVAKAVAAAVHDPTLARYWTAVENDAVIGAIAVVREWSDWHNSAYWWIQFVFVIPQARGRGVLDALVDHVTHVAGTVGSPELRLYVHPANARAARAYERLGFAPSPYRVLTRPVPCESAAARELDDQALWRGFQERAISHTRWTHSAHLRIAWLHMNRYELDEAHLRMRVGIIRLNAAHGLVETEVRGYHETLTRVWLVLVRDVRRRVSCLDSASFVATPGLEREAPLRYYSRERLFSVAARARFVAPDLAELPE
jgi:GNAT superfamily N-acetyltransferase